MNNEIMQKLRDSARKDTAYADYVIWQVQEGALSANIVEIILCIGLAKRRIAWFQTPKGEYFRPQTRMFNHVTELLYNKLFTEFTYSELLNAVENHLLYLPDENNIRKLCDEGIRALATELSQHGFQDFAQILQSMEPAAE